MKTERLSEYVMVTVVTVFGIGLALFLGMWIGGGAVGRAGLVMGGFLAMGLALFMRTNLWLLIPLLWPLTGNLPQLPASIPLRDLAIAYIFPIYFVFKALKIIRGRIKVELVDIVLMLNVAYLVTVYIRNPAGTESLGSEIIGGRPYFECLFALGAYWILCHSLITPKQAHRMPFFMIFGSLANGVLSFITYHIPQTTPIVTQFYTGVETSQFNAQDSLNQMSGGMEGREQYLSPVSSAIIRLLTAFYPVKTLVNPLHIFRLLFTLLAVFLALKSGHRSAVLYCATVCIIASYMRRGFLEIAQMAAIGLPLVGLLVLVQGNLVQLPGPAQRALSFLPGKWDYGIVAEADSSTNWRLKIWSRVLDSNKYISNKWFGDGFGITKSQMRANMEMASKTQEGTIEHAISTGDYHSGPLSAIRVVGYVGLAQFYLLCLCMMFYGYKTIRKAEGSVFYPIALFVGVFAIYKPLEFTFIFGSLRLDLPEVIFTIACLKLVTKSIDAAAPKPEEPPPAPTLRGPAALRAQQLGRPLTARPFHQ